MEAVNDFRNYLRKFDASCCYLDFPFKLCIFNASKQKVLTFVMEMYNHKISAVSSTTLEGKSMIFPPILKNQFYLVIYSVLLFICYFSSERNYIF